MLESRGVFLSPLRLVKNSPAKLHAFLFRYVLNFQCVVPPLTKIFWHCPFLAVPDRPRPYAPLAMLFAVALPLLTASRAALMLWQSERVVATGIWGMLLQGVRGDLIQLGLMALLPCC